MFVLMAHLIIELNKLEVETVNKSLIKVIFLLYLNNFLIPNKIKRIIIIIIIKEKNNLLKICIIYIEK